MTERPDRPRVVVVGAGFTGLAAAWNLARAGLDVTVIEADDEVGGLAGGFDLGETRLERFYHHWFRGDLHILAMIEDLGLTDQVLFRPSKTGLYYNDTFFRLSTPMDLLRFSALSLFDRIRLGLMLPRAKAIKNWHALDDMPAAQWLRDMVGDAAYKVVWEPLLVGKFGRYADNISAAWFWAKLAMRGGSRGKGGREELAYFRGGFAQLADHLSYAIQDAGGKVETGMPVTGVKTEGGRIIAVRSAGHTYPCEAALFTTAPALTADMLGQAIAIEEADKLRAIDYLANVCLVLVLDRPLSDLYWINVNDPSFPFVGIIEHTNFEPPETYAGRHIVYLSKYLPNDDPLYAMSPDQLFDYALPHVQRMFPDFDPAWVVERHAWRARWAQPVTEVGHRHRIPPHRGPLEGLYQFNMAQIYPEDRGTNFAVREGRRAANMILNDLGRSTD